MGNKSVRMPLSVARKNFIDDITKLISESGLPPFVIEGVLKDLYSQICSLARKQLEKDAKSYQEALEAAACTSVSLK